jgi:hypothetical protein
MSPEGWVGLVVSVVLGWISIWKALQAKDYKGALNATIDGIDDVAKREGVRGTAAGASAVKAAVTVRAVAAGMEPVLNALVKKRKDAPKPAPTPTVLGVLFLLLVPALAGCSLLGPDKTEVAAEKALWSMVNRTVEQSDVLHQQSLAQLRDYALVQALEGNRQAALDDTHVATKDGFIPAAEAERIQSWITKRNKEETDRIWAAYTAGLDPKSRRDLRQVLAKMESLRMARLSAEDLKLQALDFLMTVGKDVGIVKEEVPRGNP